MAFYVGGDTTEMEFDFYTKSAGSTVDCPLKIYRGEVDPSTLPSPTDPIWGEITSQAIIDKLKAQNEITTSNLATDKSTIQWGDKTLTKTSTIKIVDDYLNKISGSTVENPNVSKYGSSGSLLTPSNFGAELTNTSGTIDYGRLYSINSTSIAISTSTVGQMPQQLFSLDLISIFERKFGAIPKETLAEKVTWLKVNLSRIKCNAYIYGTNPIGNKAMLTAWLTSGSWNDVGKKTTTSNIITNLVYETSNCSAYINSDGFVHFLAYTDPSDGVIPSTIYTDYVSIELTLKAPENLITATNTLSDIVTDFTGKISGSIVENANIHYRCYMNTLQPPTNTNTNVSLGFAEYTQPAYNSISSLNGVIGGYNPSTIDNGIIPQALFSFNIISAVEKQLGQPIPSTDKVQWCKDNVNLTSSSLEWYGYGVNPAGNKAYVKRWNGSGWETNVYYNTSSSPSLVSAKLTYDACIQADGFVHFLAYTDASDGVTASTIYTDYVKLTIKLKYIPTYDFYTDVNTRRDAGLTNIVMVKRQIGDMTSDFTSKISGSTTQNPNIAKYVGANTLQAPTAGSEVSTEVYTNLSTLNGVKAYVMSVANGEIPQQLFSFNLIAIAEKQLGTSIPGADTASKVQWLKDNLNRVYFDWYGYGSCPTGNKAYIACYGKAWNVWGSNTASTSSKIYGNSFNWDYIRSDGFINFLAYTDASDGVTVSTINTDYVSLKLTFKSDTIGYEFFTNNSSEISVNTNNKASAFLIECDLTPIATALYGGSNASLKSALKSISADIYAMGSGANVNQLGYGINVIGYRDYSTSWGSGTMLKTNDSQTVNLLQPSVVTTVGNYTTTLNKIYFIVYSKYKSDGVIASEVNLDYVNIKVKLARIPDIPMYIDPTDDILKDHIPLELGTTWSLLLKGIAPSWGNTNSVSKVIFNVFLDYNNRLLGYFYGSSNLFKLSKIVNGVEITKSFPAITFSKFENFNLLVSYDGTQFIVNVLFNNSTIIKVIHTDARVLNNLIGLKLLLNYNNLSQADAFLENPYFFNNKTFTDEEAEVILRGRNTVAGKENDVHLNELATIFQNPLISTGFILPNNRYKATGQVKLYCNGYLIRTVQDSEFITSKYENKIELVGTAEVRRLD